MNNKKIITTFGAQGTSGPYFPQGKWVYGNTGAHSPIGSGYTIPPCEICKAWHTIAYDDMLKLKGEEQFDKFFRDCITAHYKRSSKDWQYDAYDIAYGNLIYIKQFVNGHFKQYSDLLERYLVLK